jgi:hypothetical protein
LPIVPPIDPACANAVAPAANDESIPNASINAIRQPTSFTPAMLRPPIARVFAAAFVAMVLEDVSASPLTQIKSKNIGVPRATAAFLEGSGKRQ